MLSFFFRKCYIICQIYIKRKRDKCSMFWDLGGYIIRLTFHTLVKNIHQSYPNISHRLYLTLQNGYSHQFQQVFIYYKFHLLLRKTFIALQRKVAEMVRYLKQTQRSPWYRSMTCPQMRWFLPNRSLCLPQKAGNLTLHRRHPNIYFRSHDFASLPLV